MKNTFFQFWSNLERLTLDQIAAANPYFIDAKLRFALMPSLRSSFLSETHEDNNLVTYPARVKNSYNLKTLLRQFCVIITKFTLRVSAF